MGPAKRLITAVGKNGLNVDVNSVTLGLACRQLRIECLAKLNKDGGVLLWLTNKY
jgi:hypothetical protein